MRIQHATECAITGALSALAVIGLVAWLANALAIRTIEREKKRDEEDEDP